MNESAAQPSPRLRIGAVTYLNSKPLVWGLSGRSHDFDLSFDFPSRLADALVRGSLDVALVPSIEFFRHPAGYSVVSDACVACYGPVLSVKLYFRVPPPKVRRVALDEGSRTSAALALILLSQTCGIVPSSVPLPIGTHLQDVDADAILLIGDRAMRSAPDRCVETWDLGDRWCRQTELPFVFAMWLGRPGVDTKAVAPALAAARDEGVRRLRQIATAEAPSLEISTELATQYLCDNLHFSLTARALAGLESFRARCAELNLIPSDSPSLASIRPDDCTPVDAIHS